MCDPDESPNSPANVAYAARAAAMDREYEAAWAAMPENTHAALARRGITGPEVIEHVSRQGSKDVSEFVELAAPARDFTDRERLADDLAERFTLPPAEAAKLLLWVEGLIEAESDRRRALMLARIAGPLVREKNVKVSVMGLAFAAQFGELTISGFRSMREAAQNLGCSAAYISQYANQWCDQLEIPRPAGMKSQRARDSYKTARKGNHWRNQKCPTPNK